MTTASLLPIPVVSPWTAELSDDVITGAIQTLLATKKGLDSQLIAVSTHEGLESIKKCGAVEATNLLTTAGGVPTHTVEPNCPTLFDALNE